MGKPAGFIHPRVLTALAADSGIVECFGMTVLRAEDGVCEIEAVVPQSLVNAAGFAHGSMAFALLDTACAYALGSLEVRGVTVNANTTYVRGAAAGANMTAKVEVVSRSRRVASLRGEAFIKSDGETGNGLKLAAHGTFVFQLIEVTASGGTP
jgi:uncharacterized protein (TIGR00369 family)